MTLEIREKDFEAFFNAPFEAYGSDSLYVSPMKSDLKRFLSTQENPLFESDDQLIWFTAHRDGRVVGRITAHFHAASNRLYKLKQGYFGYFDCADDQEVATALLTSAEQWLSEKGFTEIIGNFNLTAMQQIGVQTGNFDQPPYLDLMYSPSHIHQLLEANGYTRTFPMTTFESDLNNTTPPEIGAKQKTILESGDFEFVPITRSNIAERMEDARVILNDSFARNPMFVPVSAEEFHFQAKEMKWIMDPRISAMLFYRGRPAACIICVPDLNQFLLNTRSRFGMMTLWYFLKHKIGCKRAVLIYSAVVSELQGQGVNPLVLNKLITAMQQAGYEKLGGTWIADQNAPSLAQKKKMGATSLHRLHLYRKTL